MNTHNANSAIKTSLPTTITVTSLYAHVGMSCKLCSIDGTSYSMDGTCSLVHSCLSILATLYAEIMVTIIITNLFHVQLHVERSMTVYLHNTCIFRYDNQSCCVHSVYRISLGMFLCL